MAPKIELTAAGETFDRWTSFTLTRSVEEMAWTYEVELVDSWSRDAKPFPLTEGQEVTIKINGRIVLDGYLEDVAPRYDAGHHGITIGGRSRQGQLVDCAAIHKSGRWRDQPLLKIANDIVAPFGLDAAYDADLTLDAEVLKPFRKFAIQSGETCFECLERAARMRGLMMVSATERSLVFTRATKANRIPVVLGKGNVLNAARLGRWGERFSRYIVKGQTAGNDTWFGDQAARGFADAADDDVAQYRPIIVIAEGQGGREELERRATWERNVRAGRSKRLTYTVRGWEYAPGQLWVPNRLVTVDDDWLGVQAELLIARVTLLYGQQGERAGLELTDRAAFDVLAPPTPRRKGSWA